VQKQAAGPLARKLFLQASFLNREVSFRPMIAESFAGNVRNIVRNDGGILFEIQHQSKSVELRSDQ